ncbi:hypothetical protein [Aerosakkonema funiforme]|uniref:hypothetical protein n=1 Tax=Aerosakkonema funiforme TaxID=1246630 RepID=UPI0035B8D1B1
MKPMFDRSTPSQTNTKPRRILSALVLAGILSLGSSFTVLKTAVAYPQNLAQSTSETVETTSELISQSPSDARANRLPAQVDRAVRQDLSAKTGIAPGKLRITRYSRQTWPDGCLGLAEPDRICTQALVEGWRVVVSDGSKTWTYRTNSNGTILRLEDSRVSVNLPKSVEQVVSQRTATGSLRPVPIPASQLPPRLDRGILFQATSSGGITGRTYQTTLMNDGQLMRVRIGDANDSERSVRQISPQQLREFKQLLQRQSLARFNGLSYPAPRGAADYITVTVTSSTGTTRYADIVQDRLPQPLQQVVRAWSQIARG